MNKSIKKILLAISCLFVFGKTQAQDVLFKGRIQEDKTEVLLSGILVENQTQHQTAYSDVHGNFAIKAGKGDLICFSGLNYAPDTVYLTDLKYRVISLQPKLNQLNEVKVKTTEAPHVGNLNPGAETGPLGSRTVLYQPEGGLKVKLFDSHSDEKKRQKIQKLEEDNEKYQEISSTFSEENIKKHVPLTGQELKNFILVYKPSIDMYYDGSFNLTTYLNDSYKEFMKMPEEERKSTTYFQLDNLNGN